MKISSTPIVLVVASNLLRVADSKRFRVHFDVPDYFSDHIDQGPINEHGHRILQFNTSGGNRDDIIAPTTTCQNHGAHFTCNVATTLGQQEGGDEYTDLTLKVTCGLDSQIGWDFRRSQDCSCKAFAKHADPERPDKQCPCSVCPLGYGRNPASVDCSMIQPPAVSTADADANATDVVVAEDPFLLSTCSSFDCDWACNGTCKFDCTNPTPECEQLCGTEAPKDADTNGDGDGNSGQSSVGSDGATHFGTKSGSNQVTMLFGGLLTTLASAAVAWMI